MYYDFLCNRFMSWGKEILFSTCPLGQVDRKTSVKLCKVKTLCVVTHQCIHINMRNLRASLCIVGYTFQL